MNYSSILRNLNKSIINLYFYGTSSYLFHFKLSSVLVRSKKMNGNNFPLKFQGKKSHRNYIINYLTPNYTENVINSMKYFLTEEPISKYLKTYQNERYMLELKEVWNEYIDEGKSLMCTTDVEDPKLVGFLILLEDFPDSIDPKVEDEAWTKYSNIVEFVRKQSDVGNKLKIQRYITDYGLLVLPEFRGEGIAENLLKSCAFVCQDHNLPAALLFFTSIKSQTLAKKIGWQEIYSISYKELRQLDQDMYGIENIEEDAEYIKYMYIIIK